MNIALYTVSRCTLDNTLYGPMHASEDADSTLCGQPTNSNWWIENNTFDGEVTCKKCLKVFEENTRKINDKQPQP